MLLREEAMSRETLLHGKVTIVITEHLCVSVLGPREDLSGFVSEFLTGIRSVIENKTHHPVEMMVRSNDKHKTAYKISFRINEKEEAEVVFENLDKEKGTINSALFLYLCCKRAKEDGKEVMEGAKIFYKEEGWRKKKRRTVIRWKL